MRDRVRSLRSATQLRRVCGRAKQPLHTREISSSLVDTENDTAAAELQHSKALQLPFQQSCPSSCVSHCNCNTPAVVIDQLILSVALVRGRIPFDRSGDSSTSARREQRHSGIRFHAVYQRHRSPSWMGDTRITFPTPTCRLSSPSASELLCPISSLSSHLPYHPHLPPSSPHLPSPSPLRQPAPLPLPPVARWPSTFC